MTRSEFIDDLRAADDAIARLEPPPHLHDAVADRLRRPPRTNLVLVPVLAAAAIAVAFVVFSQTPDETPVAPVRPAVPGVAFVPASCAPEVPRPELDLAAGCTVSLEVPDVDILALGPARLRRFDDGFALDRGLVSFDGTLQRTPFSVFVAAGRLEGVAARFVVDVSGASGEVQVEAGEVVFQGTDGSRRVLGPAGASRWGDAEPAAPQHWSAERIDTEVRRATRLRLRGHHRAAAGQLARLLRAPLPEDAASVLSYERATLLETKLNDRTEACAQYSAHRERFGRDRYAEAVDAALSRCRGNFEGPEE